MGEPGSTSGSSLNTRVESWPMINIGLQQLIAGLVHSQHGMDQSARTHTAHGDRVQVLASTLFVPVCPSPADQWAQPTCEPDNNKYRGLKLECDLEAGGNMILQMSP